MTLDVSVLIVTYNSSRHIRPCLDSLSRALDGVASEMLVHDNDSTDDTMAVLQSIPGVRAFAGGSNLGFAAACNRLGEMSHGRHLFFLNPDTTVDPAAVKELLEAAEQHPEAGLYGARTETRDGDPVLASAQGGMTLWSLACFATGLSTLMPGRRWTDPEGLPGWDRSTSRTVPMLSGGALMVRREVWERLGGFDTRFFMYGEDADLCARARREGYRPFFVASARVQHDIGGSSSAGHKLVLLHRGKVSLVRKAWPAWQAALGVRLLLTGVALRALAARLGAFPDRPGRSAGSAWQHAWKHRSEWRRGWDER